MSSEVLDLRVCDADDTRGDNVYAAPITRPVKRKTGVSKSREKEARQP